MTIVRPSICHFLPLFILIKSDVRFTRSLPPVGSLHTLSVPFKKLTLSSWLQSLLRLMTWGQLNLSEAIFMYITVVTAVAPLLDLLGDESLDMGHFDASIHISNGPHGGINYKNINSVLLL